MLLVASSLCGKWTEDSTLALERVHMEPANDSEGYYKLLGISPDADDGEVRSAGRRLMKMTHPDNGGDQREFEMVVRAYRTLSNPLKRREYNNTRPGPKVAVRIDSVDSGFDYTAVLGEWDGEPVWYKEPADVLSPDDVDSVRIWHRMLLDAAHGFRFPMKIRAGICQRPAGFYADGEIALIGKGTVPERWAAKLFILKEMCRR